jgi:hypothetical protein
LINTLIHPVTGFPFGTIFGPIHEAVENSLSFHGSAYKQQGNDEKSAQPKSRHDLPPSG